MSKDCYGSWMVPHTTSNSSCCEQGVIFTADTYHTYTSYFIILHDWTYIWTQMKECPDNKNMPTTPL